MRCLALLALTYVAVLVTTTLASFYQGTGSIGAGPSEHARPATVESCQRHGPLSDMGLGFWWVCQVRVSTDSGVVEAVVDRSIATEQDVGKAIQLWEACYDGPNAHCRYGKAANGWWQTYLMIVKLVGRGFYLFMLGWAIAVLLAVPLGAPRYIRVGRRWILWGRKRTA